jgi:hypothetical protein
MRIDAMRRIGTVAAMVAIVLFALGGVAFAADGPTPPKLGDPVGSDISPHGGYSASTNYCLQCHEVHDATADYALLAGATVTATCNTCHGLPAIGAPAGTGARQPLEPANPATPGTTAARAAYTVTTGRNAWHGIGASTPPGETGVTMTLSDWAYSWRYSGGPPATNATTPANTKSATGGGLYCASCHTPHGEFGQLLNAKKVRTTDSSGSWSTVQTKNWTEGTIVWWDPPGAPSWKQVSLHLDTDPAAWEVCDLSGGAAQTVTPVAGGVDTVPVGACYYAQVTDTDGQLVSFYGYKLLSMYPNHTYAAPKSWGTDKYSHDVAEWCGACHPSRVSSEFGGTMHNHPTGCTACHGNPSGTAAGTGDFPHTSTNGDFLVQYPDALCISCHTGGLP